MMSHPEKIEENKKAIAITIGLFVLDIILIAIVNPWILIFIGMFMIVPMSFLVIDELNTLVDKKKNENSNKTKTFS